MIELFSLLDKIWVFGAISQLLSHLFKLPLGLLYDDSGDR